jgi:hypothetical protein
MVVRWAFLTAGAVCGILYWVLRVRGDDTGMFGTLCFVLIFLGILVFGEEKRKERNS